MLTAREAAVASRPKLYAVTYANTVDPRLAFSLGTAERHGLFPVVLGYGMSAGWAFSLSSMANLVRDYIFNHTAADDVVMFFDAFDVLFQGGEADIVDSYLKVEARTGRELLYNAEQFCSSDREAEFDRTNTPYRFLNSGIYIGRGRAFRDLFKRPFPAKLVDARGRPQRLQNWHIDYYLSNKGKVWLDSGCEVTQVAFGVEKLHLSGTRADFVDMPGGHDLVLAGGSLRNIRTNTTPPVLHFPGSGHWPDWTHRERSGTCPAYEFFRAAGHPTLARLMEKQSEGRKFFGLRPWKALCTDFVTPFDQLGMFISRFGDQVFWAIAWARESPSLALLVMLAVLTLAWLAASFAIRFWRGGARGGALRAESNDKTT